MQRGEGVARRFELNHKAETGILDHRRWWETFTLDAICTPGTRGYVEPKALARVKKELHHHCPKEMEATLGPKSRGTSLPHGHAVLPEAIPKPQQCIQNLLPRGVPRTVVTLTLHPFLK